MGYDTNKLLRDVDGTSIPQYYDSVGDKYKPEEHLRSTQLKNIGHAVATSADTIIAKPSDGEVGVYTIIAHADASLTSPTLTLKDGANLIGIFPLTAGEAEIVLQSGKAMPFSGDLVAIASASGVTLSAWAEKV